LPGYESRYEDFKKYGIDEIYCLAVNDAFVMEQWAGKLGVKNVKMLPDGNTTFTREMGMLVKKENLGFGERSWRYSMFVDDGIIKKLFIEPGISDNCPIDPFEVSGADTMLAYLQEPGR
jgi:peroxiredoxin